MAPVKVKVICRLRPPLPHEYELDQIVKVSPTSISIACPVKGTSHAFAFSSCYDAETTQEDLYENEVAQFVSQVWSGTNTTVFAYGVSGSGKTHTCSGSLDDPGLIPRAMGDLFKVVAKKRRSSTERVEVRVSYLELWRDQCHDLMVAREKGDKLEDLSIRESNGQFIVARLSESTVASCHDFEALYSAASARRTTASTKLNDTSSRSHAILTITVSTEDTATGTLVEGKLTLIDLAGSENNTKPGNEHGSDRMKESTEINKSLSALRNVVRTLNNGESHVPYRDSKLSRIMAGVLGGDAVGLLICNVAPCKRFYQETLNTLTFGAGTRRVENKPVAQERGETVGDGGKGKKREREEGNRRDSENAELRARVDMLEKLKLMLYKAKEEAAAAASSRAAQAREDERLKRFRTHLTSAQALEGVPTRSSYFSALSHYRKASVLNPAHQGVLTRISILQEAIDGHVTPSFVEQRRKTQGKASMSVSRPPPPGAAKTALGEVRNVGKAKGKEKAFEKIAKGVREEGDGVPAAKRQKVEEGERELSREDRERLEGILLDLFNTADVKEIKKLKGVGDKRARDIVEQVDEEVELQEFGDLNLSKKALDKIIKDNAHLLSLIPA